MVVFAISQKTRLAWMLDFQLLLVRLGILKGVNLEESVVEVARSSASSRQSEADG
jgi:hypothetical protein